ncbi:MAG TPA: HEAT repeat domain-containing protein [Candidatus Binatia bacterium]|jgi:HEAT repeat protein|nr:HEAT repeat domain-containing protein [Candidatus Binatia bacterium]
MDTTLRQLLTLAREGTVERRCAALLVLGALQLRDDAIVESAGAALEQANVVLKDYALRYFEDTQAKTGIPLLLPLLGDADKEVQERVIRLLSRVGQAVVRPALQHARTAPRLWQLNAARVLCTVRGKAAWKGLLPLLSQGDSEFNRTVCDLVVATLREMNEQEQGELYTEVEAFARTLDEHEQRPALISAIRLLGQLGRPQSRRWLVDFVGPDHHHSVRFHALVALLHCLHGQALQKGEFARLLPVLEEAEFSDAVRLTLELLEAHPLPEEYQSVLSRLVESAHVAVQKFALRKMGEFDSPAVVRALAQQLGDPDAARRDAAARSLQKLPSARPVLTKEFLACEDAGKAWAIAQILPVYEGKWRRDTLDAVWERLRTATAEDDRIQGAYLYFLKGVDAAYAYAQLAARGAQLTQKKQYREAIKVLTPLKEFPTFQAEDQYHLALAQLKLHPHAVESLARRHEPALELLAGLYRSSAFPLLETLKKEKALEPADLFYVGFHFAEGAADERDLGRDILQLLATRYPRTNLGKSAKNKLKLLAE